MEYAAFVKKYENLVYTVCWQFTQNHHTAQDLAQETFVSAYLHWESCPKDNPKAWVCRIATNKAKDYLKSAYHRKINTFGEEGIENGKILFMDEALPEQVADGREVRKKVADAIEKLGEPYSGVAKLSLLGGYTVNEISAGLARPQKTVQTQLYRARGKLRQSLAPLYAV